MRYIDRRVNDKLFNKHFLTYLLEHDVIRYLYFFNNSNYRLDNNLLIKKSHYFFTKMYITLNTRIPVSKMYLIIYIILFFKIIFLNEVFIISSKKKKIKSKRKTFRNICIRLFTSRINIRSNLLFIFETVYDFNRNFSVIRHTSYINKTQFSFFFKKKLFFYNINFGVSYNQLFICFKNLFKDDSFIKKKLFFNIEEHYIKINLATNFFFTLDHNLFLWYNLYPYNYNPF